MRSMILVICGAVLGVCILLFAFRHHLILADSGMLVIAKRQCTLNDTFVDVRDWNTSHWAEHPDLLQTVYLTH